MVSNYAVNESVFMHIPEYVKSLIFCMGSSPEVPGRHIVHISQ